MIRNLFISAAISATVCVGLAGCARSHQLAAPGMFSDECHAKGDVRVTVVHLDTKELLPGIPVTIRGGPKSDWSNSRRVVVTEKNGEALFTNLKMGSYEALVFLNNISSEAVKFILEDQTPNAAVTVLFNPDIDD